MCKILTLFRGPTGSEENDIDCVLIRSEPICELVDIELIDEVLSFVVFVADQKQCLFLVINDTMTDEGDKI